MATAKKTTTKKTAAKKAAPKAAKKPSMAEIKRKIASGKLTKEQANKLRQQYMDSIEYK